MTLSDTILALASPPGRSTRAILRISGPATGDLLRARIDPPPGVPGASRARFALSDRISLPVLVALYAAPRSYTGEDAAEILIPGNPSLATRVVAALSGPGVRPARPGEFTARAFLAGKLTLEQAEGVAAVIAAETSDDLHAARELRDGRTGRAYAALADEIAGLLALVEAGIDFTDQEGVVAIEPAALVARLDAVQCDIVRLLGSAPGSVRHEAPGVALVGAPNAGKSTLFNALLGRQRAVASPDAGTTRDVLAEELDLSADAPGASPVVLMDLPGLDAQATDAPGRLAQRHAVAAIAAADLLVWCDPSGRFEAGPRPIMAGEGQGVLRVRTFADRPGALADDCVAVCALDGWNVATLRRTIADRAFAGRGRGVAALLPRHRRALSRAREEVAGALDLARGGEGARGPELVAAALRGALDALDEIVGRISPDEVLGRIFASFCVGK